VGEPECNGVAGCFIRTLKEDCIYLHDSRRPERWSGPLSSATTTAGSSSGTGTWPRPVLARTQPEGGLMFKPSACPEVRDHPTRLLELSAGMPQPDPAERYQGRSARLWYHPSRWSPVGADPRVTDNQEAVSERCRCLGRLSATPFPTGTVERI